MTIRGAFIGAAGGVAIGYLGMTVDSQTGMLLTRPLTPILGPWAPILFWTNVVPVGGAVVGLMYY